MEVYRWLNAERVKMKIKLTGSGSYISEPGEYICKITKVVDGITTNGDQKIEIFMEDKNGASIRDNIAIKENCLWKLSSLLISAGLANEEEIGEDIEFEQNELINRYVKIIVTKKDEDRYASVKTYLNHNAKNKPIAKTTAEDVPF
jgi:hypothetical protein